MDCVIPSLIFFTHKDLGDVVVREPIAIVTPSSYIGATNSQGGVVSHVHGIWKAITGCFCNVEVVLSHFGTRNLLEWTKDWCVKFQVEGITALMTTR